MRCGRYSARVCIGAMAERMAHAVKIRLHDEDDADMVFGGRKSLPAVDGI
jgi:hypothetical protein